MFNVVVNGALGKMGREVIANLCREPDMEPVGAVDKLAEEPKLELPDHSGSISLSVDLGSILAQTNPQVLVDFTNADGAMAAVSVAAVRGVNLVIGSTGIGEAELREMDRLGRENQVGIIAAPNFSIGAVLLTHLAKQAAPYFEYADVVESHHDAKLDAPSGTALAIAKAIAESGTFKRVATVKETLSGTRGGDYEGISIHSIRNAGRSADHEVVLATAGQTLSIRHDTIGRECYMPGVTRAIREVVKLKGLVVGLGKILGL